MPDGSRPFQLMLVWSTFVQDCIMLFDDKCTFRHWKYPGSYSEQPWLDIQIYLIIRAKWIELKNAKIKQEINFSKSKKPSVSSYRRPTLRSRRR